MIHQFKQLLWTSRPVSWVNTAYPFGATYLVLGGKANTFFYVTCLFFLIPYNYLMYGLNDVYDYESDIKNPRKNSIEGAITEKKLHKTIVFSSIGLAVPFSLYILSQSHLAAQLVFITSLFFVAAYSVPYLRFKEKAFIDSFTSACHFTLPMLFAFVLLGWQPHYGLFALSLFFWSMASHAFGAVQDIIPDTKGGIGSIATIIGASQTVCFAILLYSLSALTLLATGTVPIFITLIPFLYVLNIVPYVKVTRKNAANSNTAWRRFIYVNFLSGTIITMYLIYRAVGGN